MVWIAIAAIAIFLIGAIFMTWEILSHDPQGPSRDSMSWPHIRRRLGQADVDEVDRK